MSKLKFSDGMEFDLSTPIHPELREDGWYVVGNNVLVPVNSYEEAWNYIRDMLGENDSTTWPYMAIYKK